MGSTISGFDGTSVLNMIPISETIKALSIIKCDVCKTAAASHDVFMKGTGEVAFLKRYCEQCVKSVSETQGKS
jgi:hypothetical protein